MKCHTQKKMKNLIYYKDVFFYLFNVIKINEKDFKKIKNKTPSHISLKCTNNSSLQALFTLRICKFSYIPALWVKGVSEDYLSNIQIAAVPANHEGLPFCLTLRVCEEIALNNGTILLIIIEYYCPLQ